MECNKLIQSRLCAGVWGLIALLVGAGCTRRSDPAVQVPALSLSPSFGAVSRAGFAASDAIGVWATADGRQNDALSNQKFVAAADGVTFTANPSAYYPNAQDAVRLYAYFPYQAGASAPHAVAFSVQTDQSSPADLKLSDLCWGSTQTTPSEAPVPLAFQHVLAKIEVSVASGLPSGTSLSRVVWRDAVADGSLDVRTGIFAAGSTRVSLAGTSAELVAPAQALGRLELELSDGSRYTYEPTSTTNLQAGCVHSVFLTLHASLHNAELAVPIAVAPWTETAGSGTIRSGVWNTFGVHWLLPHPDYGSTATVVLHARNPFAALDVPLTSSRVVVDVSNRNAPGVGYLEFEVGGVHGVAGLHYPYELTGIDFLRSDGSVIQSCADSLMLNKLVYKAGDATLGLYQSNVLFVTSGKNAPWQDWAHEGRWDNIKYENNTFTVRVIEPDFDYTAVRKVRLSIWGGVAEWNIAAPTVSAGYTNFVVEYAPFSFPDANGYMPAVRHYPIEWVELADGAGKHLYRGYCSIEVTDKGAVTLLLYQKGTIYSPSSVVRQTGQTVTGALSNIPFVGNTLTVRFISPDFLDAARPAPHTVRMGIYGDVYEWRGIAMDPSSNFFTAFTTLAFPDANGSRPTNQYYTVLWVEVYGAAGQYLYKSYCNVDVTRSGAVTLDLHQRGVLGGTSGVVRPADQTGEAHPNSGSPYVVNTHNVYFLDCSFAFYDVRTVAFTVSDGKTYTWNTPGGLGLANGLSVYAAHSWPDRSGTRPAAYPYTVTKIEAKDGSGATLYSRSVDYTVSASAASTMNEYSYNYFYCPK